MILDRNARKTIAAVAADAAATVADRPIPGPSKFRSATALGMRRLKADGMPQALADGFAGFIKADDLDDGDEGLSSDETALVDGISDAAGAGVGVIADKIERDTGCKCNRQILALIRALLQTGIEVAARSL